MNSFVLPIKISKDYADSGEGNTKKLKSLKVTKQMKDEGCLGVWVTDCWTEGHGDCCVAFLTANRDKSKNQL